MPKNIKPLKKFGQNYLVDKNITRKIVEEISPEKTDKIVEIGPGKGSITELIYNRCRNLHLVEIDTRVIENLRQKFPEAEIINDDFLKLDLGKIGDGRKIKVCGNIPYNITSPIIFKLITQRGGIKDAILMIQDEVARRIMAKPGTKEYGILSVILGYFTNVRYCFKISPNVFYPKPKVNSALIHIMFDKELSEGLNDIHFIQTVKAAFGNRRKTLKNSLSNSIFKNCDFSKISLDLSQRAETLSLNQFILLSEELGRLQNE